MVLPVEIRGRVGDLERRRIRAACDASLVSSGGCVVFLVSSVARRTIIIVHVQ